jgi:hypothetical protein
MTTTNNNLNPAIPSVAATGGFGFGGTSTEGFAFGSTPFG